MMERIEMDRSMLQALFDIAVNSMDFGSGFLGNEEVENLRAVAELLGVDTADATPRKFMCQYEHGGKHEWREYSGAFNFRPAQNHCTRCGAWSHE